MEIHGARPLGIFGDSVTTDHISPAGAIKKDSPAGRYLVENGVDFADFNSYGSRRGNDRIMTRGTFANVRIKNLMVPGIEGGVTRYFTGPRPRRTTTSWQETHELANGTVTGPGHANGGRRHPRHLRRRRRLSESRTSPPSSSAARTTAWAPAATGPPRAPTC